MNRQLATVGVVLAAGGSSRLGFPKQLVRFRGRPLIVHAVEQLKQTDVDSIYVVIGAAESNMRAALTPSVLPMRNILVNPDWRSGQASSLTTAVRSLRKRTAMLGKLVVMLCDQPWINGSHLQSLISGVDDRTICCCTRYPDGGGVPACFHADRLEDLLQHLETGGAKRWIRQQSDSVCRQVISPGGTMDIDYPEDVERFQLEY